MQNNDGFCIIIFTPTAVMGKIRLNGDVTRPVSLEAVCDLSGENPSNSLILTC